MDFWVFVIIMTGISSAPTAAVKVVQRWRAKPHERSAAGRPISLPPDAT